VVFVSLHSETLKIMKFADIKKDVAFHKILGNEELKETYTPQYFGILG
jgi:hypothetical protein